MKKHQEPVMIELERVKPLKSGLLRRLKPYTDMVREAAGEEGYHETSKL